MKRNGAAVFLFLVAFALYLSQIAPSVTAGDSGEFMTAAGTLSVPHAPSFPLYTISTRGFLELIPWGAIPYRTNLFSAFVSSLSLAVVFFLAFELSKNVFTALLVPFLIGWSSSFWANSLVTEVFSLNTFILCALIGCLLKGQENPKYRALLAFVMGLGLGNHHILVTAAPAFLFAWIILEGINSFWKRIPLYAGLFLLGLSIYAFLPMRAAKAPPINWGNPTTAERFVRTITRKDYGSLKLAIGEAPERNLKNTFRHLKNFGTALNRETAWPILLLGGLGLLLGIKREKVFYGSVGFIFLFSGPIFYVFSNLPFIGQSEGIMGRFFIMPALCLLLGWIEIARRLQKAGPVILVGLVAFGWFKGHVEASDHRNARLVWDYGNAILRTMPRDGILFMDGGDDAFYSLACLHYVLGKRPDVELHDRGGLVYKNIYGDDFRRLNKEGKNERRWLVEKKALAARPVYYSTMDPNVLPGVATRQVGFLLQAGTPKEKLIDWPLLIIRSLYPMDVADYRTRALAAFFPYMQGRQILNEGMLDKGLAYYKKAAEIGPNVDWLQVNMGYEYAHRSYDLLVQKRYAESEKIYRDWIGYSPADFQAQSNFGVVLERQGRLEEALAQYQKTADLFPTQADPLYNIAVALWSGQDWERIRPYLISALQRNPNHTGARGALFKVDQALRRGK